MKKGRKRNISVLLAVLHLLLLILPGCGDSVYTPEENTKAYAPDEEITLRVLTQETMMESFSVELTELADRFMETYSNVDIVIEELPNDVEARVDTLERLRKEMEAGEGPDIYLLPTITDVYGLSEELFPDVQAAMRSDRFADLSDYYNEDEELDKKNLNEAVMDVGVVDGFRYVLPLRYDFPVAYVNPAELADVGLSTELFRIGATGMWDAIAQSSNSDIAVSAHFPLMTNVLNFFPDLLDYDRQKVLLSKTELAELIDSYTRCSVVRGNESPITDEANAYMYVEGKHWTQLGKCIDVGSLDEALLQAAFAEASGVELEMYPLTSADGRLTAEVSFYGAVDADCVYPQVAYNLLRECLLEEFQWVSYRNWAYSDFFITGYPVRSVESVTDYYQHICQGYAVEAYHDNDRALVQTLSELDLTNEDIPVLQAEIDAIRFPLPDLEAQLWSAIKNAEYGNDPYAIAEDFVTKLEDHLISNTPS